MVQTINGTSTSDCHLFTRDSRILFTATDLEKVYPSHSYLQTVQMNLSLDIIVEAARPIQNPDLASPI